jgi:thiol-disulfide isomerase/thioredoxin
MNLQKEFEQAMTLAEYNETLGEQSALHDLHYKKAVINFEVPQNLNLNILVITEPWCGDSTAIIPVIEKLFADTNVEIRMVHRDENPELMDRFLTNGARAIPVFIMLDKKGNYISRFGSRPSKAKAIFESYRKDILEGKIEKPEVTKKIRTFYAKDRGRAILNDFTAILNEFLTEQRILEYGSTAAETPASYK